ncbi:MAG: hypothetical protein ACKPKO_48010, partial [Candidatus Fonsibacter sp.]
LWQVFMPPMVVVWCSMPAEVLARLELGATGAGVSVLELGPWVEHCDRQKHWGIYRTLGVRQELWGLDKTVAKLISTEGSTHACVRIPSAGRIRVTPDLAGSIRPVTA